MHTVESMQFEKYKNILCIPHNDGALRRPRMLVGLHLEDYAGQFYSMHTPWGVWDAGYGVFGPDTNGYISSRWPQEISIVQKIIQPADEVLMVFPRGQQLNRRVDSSIETDEQMIEYNKLAIKLCEMQKEMWEHFSENPVVFNINYDETIQKLQETIKRFSDAIYTHRRADVRELYKRRHAKLDMINQRLELILPRLQYKFVLEAKKRQRALERSIQEWPKRV